MIENISIDNVICNHINKNNHNGYIKCNNGNKYKSIQHIFIQCNYIKLIDNIFLSFCMCRKYEHNLYNTKHIYVNMHNVKTNPLR